uniref:Phorbol-ester/DAG-type domain-containing protein n=1 Tax=Amphiprion percula TaxID=161767 RepID=A0A3P8U136_AMPPE
RSGPLTSSGLLVRSPSHRRGRGRLRARRKAFRPPDVRTIFEKDPRVQEESGEGHSFQAVGENTWCDVCCLYIFQQGLTCAGRSWRLRVRRV